MKSILIVEDEAIIAMNIAHQLSKAGFSIFGPVATGEEAVEKALECKCDVVLCDVNLKGQMNGLEAAQKMNASGLDSKVVFMTGYGKKQYEDQVDEGYTLAFLEKPINMKVVMDLLNPPAE